MTVRREVKKLVIENTRYSNLKAKSQNRFQHSNNAACNNLLYLFTRAKLCNMQDRHYTSMLQCYLKKRR